MPLPDPDERLRDSLEKVSSNEAADVAHAISDRAQSDTEADEILHLRTLFEEIGEELTRSGDELEKTMARHPWLVASASVFLGMALAHLFTRSKS